MIMISITEAVNGYMVDIFDSAKKGRQLPETVTRYTDALSLVRNWIGREMDAEAKKIQAAMRVI